MSADGASTNRDPANMAGCTASEIPALCITGSGYKITDSGPYPMTSAHAREL